MFMDSITLHHQELHPQLASPASLLNSTRAWLLRGYKSTTELIYGAVNLPFKLYAPA
jgi:hypothetical protein